MRCLGVGISSGASAPVNKIPLEQRVSGDVLLGEQDALDLVREVGGKADNNGYVTLYHRTSKEKAKQIIETKKMSAKEDGIFFVPDDFFENEARFGNPPSPKSLSGKKQRYENAVKNRTQTLYTL